MPCTCDNESVPCAVLVSASLAGDEAAYADLLRKFAPLIIHIGRRYSSRGLRFDAGDSVQYLAAHLLKRRKRDLAIRLSLWSQRGKFCKWLGSVTARMCLTLLRSWEPLGTGGDDDADKIEPVSNLPPPDTGAIARDRLAAIERRVAGFPIDHQIVFWNHFIHGLTYEELGRILDKNERVLRRWMNEIKAEITDL